MKAEQRKEPRPSRSFIIEEVAPDLFKVISRKMRGKRKPREETGTYYVDLRNPSCTCMWWTLKGMKEECKHIRLCEYYLKAHSPGNRSFPPKKYASKIKPHPTPPASLSSARTP